jgi:hypothetical protein
MCCDNDTKSDETNCNKRCAEDDTEWTWRDEVSYYAGRAFNLFAVWVVLWMLFSFTTSYLKTNYNECGLTYQAERTMFLNGNWFCQVKD